MFKIFVGNVNFKTTEDQLRELFEPHLDEIEDVVIARDPETGRSRGYGFVMTRDHEQGKEAIRNIGKARIDGRLVYLKQAHGKRKRAKPTTGAPAGHRGPRRMRDRPRQTAHRGSRRPMRSQGYAGLNDRDDSSRRRSGGYTGAPE
jgi:RNA recognition motif-containing protein